jgi:hypothetical protein
LFRLPGIPSDFANKVIYRGRHMMADRDEKESVAQHEHNDAAAPSVFGNEYDTVVSSLVLQDDIPWYRKRNLRRLYLLFVGSVLCVETTSGYDASVTNGLQSVPTWVSCTSSRPHMSTTRNADLTSLR